MKGKRITKQPTAQSGKFRAINTNLSLVVTAMAHQLQILERDPQKRYDSYKKLTGFCYGPPVESDFGHITKPRGRSRVRYWKVRRPEFGFSSCGNPKERVAHELFYILSRKLPWDTELKMWRMCKTLGCCNPEHYELHITQDDPYKTRILDQLNKLEKETQKCQ